MGKNQKMLHPDEKPLKYRLNKPDEQVERKIITKTGEIRDVTIKENIITLQSRNVLKGIFHDITEEKRKTRQLQESQEKFKALFEMNPEAVYFLNDKYRFLEVNTGFSKLFGYSREDLLNSSLLDMVALERVLRNLV